MAHWIANTLVVGSALGVVLVAVQQTTHVLPGSKRVFTLDRERCYGVARAGKNDCGTASHACAGQAPRDAKRDEWLMLPAGTCMKIAGGQGKPGPL
jgi:uncharacterized membrane protein